MRLSSVQDPPVGLEPPARLIRIAHHAEDVIELEDGDPRD
jgi:hypothetical protein